MGDKKVKVLSVVIITGFLIFFVLAFSQAEGPDWRLYWTSDDVLYLYDARSITKSKDILKVSEKSVGRQKKQYNFPQALTKIMEINKEGSGEMSDEIRKKTIDALALQVTRRLYEIRCSPKRYRMITGMKYDNEGILIDGIISLEWGTINPGSIIEKLYNEVCH
jgi:hypothetical protein